MIYRTIVETEEALTKYAESSIHGKEVLESIAHATSVKTSMSGVYMIYPKLFAPFFSKNTAKELNKLCLAGYLIYYAALRIDTIVDGESINIPHDVLLANLYTEEYSKLLRDLFSEKSNFWLCWHQRQQEFKTLLKLSKSRSEGIDWDLFEEIADKKSVFGKSCIDALMVLNNMENSETPVKQLLYSHKQFSVGLQILDDLMDFKIDISTNQYNIAVESVITDGISKRQDLKETEGLAKAYNNLYSHGVAESLLSKSIEYFKKSMDLIHETGTKGTLWEELVSTKLRNAKTLLGNIETYRDTLVSKTKLSNKVLGTDSAVQFLEKATGFLFSSLDKDEIWSDYWNHAGTSDIWVPSFIASNVYSYVNKEQKEKLTNHFLTHKKENGWGYNNYWIEDNDSTTSVMLALHLLGEDIEEEKNKWHSMRTADGLYGTYVNEDYLRASLMFDGRNDVSGWVQSHVCVSSLAFYFSATTDPKGKLTEELQKKLLKAQLDSGLWQSYWWTSPLYSTSFAVRGLFLNEGVATPEIQKALNAIQKQQNQDGSFSDKIGQKSPFYTALSLLALLVDHQNYDTTISQAKNWLLANQYDDGSLPSTNMLVIPSAGTKVVPQLTSEWFNKKATNTIIGDYKRNFTTSVCVNAISNWTKIYKS